MPGTAAQGRRYASLKEASAYLGGVNERTVRRMVARGDITGFRMPGSRLVRVDLNEIDDAVRVVPTGAA